MMTVKHRQRFAVGMHREYGPCFGDDLVIYDKANHSTSCWSNFPDVYCGIKDGKKLPHTPIVLKDFIGTSEHYEKFNIIEWEVYKINFSKKEEVDESFLIEYNKL